jgi:hypothetical protein
MLESLWLWFWKQDMEGYRLVRITGWNSALVDDIRPGHGSRRHVWFEKKAPRQNHAPKT